MNRNADIQLKIIRELLADPLLQPIAATITVKVEGNVATLAGTVNSFQLKNALEEAALRVSEVQVVSLDIQVPESA